MSDSHTDAVIAATVQRFRKIAAEYTENAGMQEFLTKRQETLQQMAQQCYGTASLFEFDLMAEVSKADMQAAGNIAVSSQMPPPSPPITPPKLLTVRDFVLDAAKTAYPQPVRAADLRQQLELQGKPTHEKTIGMTLYRLAREERAMRRQGKADWYFVPENEREIMGVDGDVPEPSLFDEAAE